MIKMVANYRTGVVFLLVAICFFACGTSPASENSPAPNAAPSLTNISENRGCSDILTTLNDIVRQLEDKKTTRYPPVYSQNDNVVVPAQINLLPLRLLHVDDARSRLEIGILVHVFWHDPRLAWANTTTYDKDCTPKLPARLSFRDIRNIWTPIFVLAETSSPSKQGLHEIFESMQISQNGSVFYVGRYRGDLVCPMKRKYYPFDEQICNITVLGGGHMRYEVGHSWAGHHQPATTTTTAVDKTVNKTHHQDFLKHVLDSYKKTVYEAHVFGRQMTTSEWDLNPTDEQLVASLTQPIAIKHPQLHTAEIKLPHTDDVHAQSLVFHVYLKRNSWPLVWTMVIPPIVIVTAAVTGLYLGCPINARFGFGSSIVITLSLLIRNVKDTLEAGDDGIPLLEWLYLGLFLSMILATTMSEVPRALAKRIKKQREKDSGQPETKTYASRFRRNCCLIPVVGVEETINICFACCFLSFQAALIGYVVITWLSGPRNLM